MYLNGGLSPSKKVVFICFNESSLKMIKNAFYFMLNHEVFGLSGSRPSYPAPGSPKIFN